MKSIISGITLVIVLYAMNSKIGSIPPLGKFFDPNAGFWTNAETSLPESEELNIEGLMDEVSIVFDERRVPHIFAQNEHDLFFAQGYITAQQRLFQMEIQTYDAAGRLSELIGENPRVQERDLETRRLGMLWAAEKKMDVAMQDSASARILNAYSEGVNAYIQQLAPTEYPLEYKVLDFSPEPWSPLKTSLLHMSMLETLAGGSSDDRTSRTKAFFGQDYIDKFFNTDPEMLEAIIPKSKVWEFDAVRPPKPDSNFKPKTAERIQYWEPNAGVGSNNWAVDGTKTASGYPILAGDPHLNLSLPSIWMEMQLHAPGYNTYGVTFQGGAGILIGFNEHIAFSVTNTGSDVMDWYEIEFKDASKNEYWYDGSWVATKKRIEEIKIRDGETIIDTLVFTHHGPVMLANPDDTLAEPIYHAMRWIGHEAGNFLSTFIGLNKATNYDEYVEALKSYIAPAQNFVFASNEGDIAIWVNGQFPNKWDYQGQMVSDGRDPAYDWQGWIPHAHNPHIKNPASSFVSSANQEPVDNSYPYYMADEYAPYERGRRINDLLRSMDDITPQDMMYMQMDNFSMHAESIMPNLLNWLEVDSLSMEEVEFSSEMNSWNYEMNADLKQPGFFNYWWRELYRSIFRDEYEASGATLRYPHRDRVVEVLKNEPNFEFIDNITTDEKETMQQLVTAAYKKAYNTMATYYGSVGEQWNWGYVMDNDIDHVGQILGLGANDVYSGGSYEAINATGFGYGPSWRMVVELGSEIKGWGVYPGGISGNPGSPNYNAFTDNWRNGKHFELNFYREKPNASLYQLTLNGGN
jgi:penicillin amidase